MVLLVVKGTKFPDEFTVERRVTDRVTDSPVDACRDDGGECKDKCPNSGSGGLARSICHLQNSRHHLRLLLLSAHELAEHLGRDPSQLLDTQERVLSEYRRVVEEQTAVLKDKTTPVADEHQFDRAAERLRELTTQLYPRYCTQPAPTAADADKSEDAQKEAVIQALYAMHENPELGEDERLIVYHCRAILDLQWKANEAEREDEAGLWFCGKLMASGPLSDYCGRNERSKVTVKVAPRTGPAPSGEPRMRYEDQRALYAHMRQRKETYRQLEESELRDRVVRQSRGTVVMPPASPLPSSATASVGAGGNGMTLKTSQLRPIYPQREERVVSE